MLSLFHQALPAAKAGGQNLQDKILPLPPVHVASQAAHGGPGITEALEEHRKWAESKGKLGRRADLTGANLSGADLSGVDLRDAFLRKANLEKADFLVADLRCVCLVQANLRGANLLGTRLREAGLQGANLEGASGLLAEQLAGANLFGATLPESISGVHSEKIWEAERASRRARALFWTLLLASLSMALVAVTTTDLRLFRNAPTLPVPYLGQAMPLVEFYLVAPIVLLALYISFHLSLRQLWERLSELPAVFPDGQRLDQKGRWLLAGLIWDHMKWPDEDRLAPSLLESAIQVLPAYWVATATLVLLWARYLTRMDQQGAAYHVMLIMVSVALAVFLPGRVARMFRGESASAPLSSEGPGRSTVLQRCALTLGVGIFFSLLSFGTIYGAPHNRQSTEWSPLDPRQWAPEVLWWAGYDPYPNLSEADISVKPASWTGREQELSLVRGARLDNLCLRRVEAFRAFLVNARLRGTDFEHANLAEADLRGANLHRAILRSAVLDRALIYHANLDGAEMDRVSLVRVDLSEADLSYAQLTEANLQAANLTSSNLYAANLRGASLSGARLEKADLRESNLENARLGHVDLREAQLWSAKLSGAKLQDAQLQNAFLIEADLRKADLRGANLQKALLNRTVFDGAILDGADLRGAVGLTADQVCSTVGWQSAQLDPDLQQQAYKQCPGRSSAIEQ